MSLALPPTRTLLAALLATLVAAPPAARGAEPPPAPSPAAMAAALRVGPGATERLAWLAGCWADGDATRGVEEQWMAPRGGAMLGMSRTVRGGRVVAWEHTRIEARDSTLLFVAHPSGQREAAFALVALGDSAATFADPEHDFPQRVTYRLRADGSVLGRIEGRRGGAERGVDFPLRRVPCPGGATR